MNAIYSTILFDFDGTLTSSLELWLRAFHYAFSKYDIQLTNETIIKRCFYRAMSEVVSEFGVPLTSDFTKDIKEGLAIYFEEAKLFSGVPEILAHCANENIRLSVVTSSPRMIVERTLKNLGILLYFETIVTADDIANFKPHPEPVLLALKRMGSKAEKALVIGDSHADILAGRAAGLKTGLFYPDIHEQFYDLQKLRETDPHFVFHNFADLKAHIFEDGALL